MDDKRNPGKAVEIMHLFIAREALDRHMELAFDLVDPEVPWSTKLRRLPKIALYYAWWYPTRFAVWGAWRRYRTFGDLARHARYCSRAARRLARATFHGMLRYRLTLEKRQAFLFRLVDIGVDLFAMTAVLLRARSIDDDDHGEPAHELAGLFARDMRRRIESRFRCLWSNEDRLATKVGHRLLDGHYRFVEGEESLPDAVEFEPAAVDEMMNSSEVDRKVG